MSSKETKIDIYNSESSTTSQANNWAHNLTDIISNIQIDPTPSLIVCFMYILDTKKFYHYVYIYKLRKRIKERLCLYQFQVCISKIYRKLYSSAKQNREEKTIIKKTFFFSRSGSKVQPRDIYIYIYIYIYILIQYIDITISQNTTQFYAQYVQYISQLHVSAHFRPSSGCSLQPSECGKLYIQF